MCDLEEWTLNLTRDKRSGAMFAYVLRAEEGQWGWIADRDFGPFDTMLEVVAWATRAIVNDGVRRLV